MGHINYFFEEYDPNFELFSEMESNY